MTTTTDHQLIERWSFDGDVANEASLFTPDLLLSESLITSKDFRWHQIDLCESPVVMACGGPPCAPGVPAVSDDGRWFVIGGILLLGSLLLYRMRSRAQIDV